jgi:CRISPR-associated protein Cmr1
MVRKKPEKLDPPQVKKWNEGKQERQEEGKEIVFVQTIGNTEVVVQTRQYRLITPLFGGGVEPGVNDLDNLIRGTEIRGQLRFWWRAIRGWQFDSDLKKMKDREDEIWGAASNTEKQYSYHQESGGEDRGKATWKAPVQIEVEVQAANAGNAKKPFKPDWNNERTKIIAPPDPNIPGYAAFPLRPTEDELKVAKRAGGPEHVFVEDIRENIVFVIHLVFPQIWKKEIKAALWAWETFGGVGARTRRGFGVVLLENIDGKEEIDLPFASVPEAKNWMNQKLDHWIKGATYPENLPHLSTDMFICIIGPVNRPLFAWKNIIKKLQEFRQIPYGRDKRSKWPEAEAIREITEYRHDKFHRLNHPQKFPRAAFGLPIVFHFKDENKREPFRKDYDPPEMTLQGASEGQERWASPLILKPLICQNGQALGLACILQGSRLPEQLLLKPKDQRIQPYDVNTTQTSLTSKEAALLPVQGQTDILQAFLKFLKQ